MTSSWTAQVDIWPGRMCRDFIRSPEMLGSVRTLNGTRSGQCEREGPPWPTPLHTREGPPASLSKSMAIGSATSQDRATQPRTPPNHSPSPRQSLRTNSCWGCTVRRKGLVTLWCRPASVGGWSITAGNRSRSRPVSGSGRRVTCRLRSRRVCGFPTSAERARARRSRGLSRLSWRSRWRVPHLKPVLRWAPGEPPGTRRGR